MARRKKKVGARVAPANNLGDARRAVQGLRVLQQRIRGRSKASVSDADVRVAISIGRR